MFLYWAIMKSSRHSISFHLPGQYSLSFPSGCFWLRFLLVDCANSLANEESDLMLYCKATWLLWIEEKCFSAIILAHCKHIAAVKLQKLEKQTIIVYNIISWMILLPDKIYPALSLKCMVLNPGMNLNKLFYIDEEMLTKKLIWPSNSSVYWELSLWFVPAGYWASKVIT